MSEFLALIGGGPQGTLIGQIEYLVQSNDNADMAAPEDRFKYIDDLSILQLVLLAGLVTDYNFYNHVASDIATNQNFLPPQNFESQSNLDSVKQWTDNKLMKLNEKKSKVIIFNFTHN
jgi:hypothetical protein